MNRGLLERQFEECEDGRALTAMVNNEGFLKDIIRFGSTEKLLNLIKWTTEHLKFVIHKSSVIKTPGFWSKVSDEDRKAVRDAVDMVENGNMEQAMEDYEDGDTVAVTRYVKAGNRFFKQTRKTSEISEEELQEIMKNA